MISSVSIPMGLRILILYPVFACNSKKMVLLLSKFMNRLLQVNKSKHPFVKSGESSPQDQETLHCKFLELL